MKKKLVALGMASVMAASLAACGSSSGMPQRTPLLRSRRRQLLLPPRQTPWQRRVLQRAAISRQT